MIGEQLLRLREKILRRLEFMKKARKFASLVPEENQELLASVASYWTSDRIAEGMKKMISGSLDGRRLYESVITAIPEIAQYNTVLDFGSGTGWVSRHLSYRYPNIRFYCYDLAYRASEELIRSLKNSSDIEKISFHDSYDHLLPKCDLVLSNMVFSALAPQHLNHCLSRFKENGCDLIFMSNSFLKQRRGSAASRSRDSGLRYCHNFLYYLDRHGYELKWLYTLSLSGKDKKVIIGYATA